MLDRVVSSSKLTAIANAIRTKAGTQSSMTLDDMPTAIANIPSGGSSTIDLTGYAGTNWATAVAPLLNTSGMTDMSYMFYYQRTATSIDVSNFDTSNVTSMENMFNGCGSLTSLDLDNWDTSKVTSMKNMFHYCDHLTTIHNLSNLTTSNVTDMSYMFSNCQRLPSLDITHFDTSKVTTMWYMFQYLGYQNLNPLSLDLSNFRTSLVTNMGGMFSNASLTSLDLDNWNTSSVTNMSSMFYRAFPHPVSNKMWVPSTFVATSVTMASYKPFYADPYRSVDVYTDATDATTQGWGAIHTNYTIHYNTTHQDFLNA